MPSTAFTGDGLYENPIGWERREGGILFLKENEDFGVIRWDGDGHGVEGRDGAIGVNGKFFGGAAAIGGEADEGGGRVLGNNAVGDGEHVAAATFGAAVGAGEGGLED